MHLLENTDICFMKVSRYYLLFSLLLMSPSLFSQEDTPGKGGSKVGIYFASFGDNPALPFEMLVGAPSYSGAGFYTLGLSYALPISKRFDFETGLSFSKHTLEVQPNLPPDMDDTPYETTLHLFTVPLTVRLNLGRFFFLNGGAMLNMDTGLSNPVDNQSGIGAMLGFGLGYEFHSGISFYINPYMKAHGLLPFVPDQYNHHLMETGIQFGVSYRLN